MKTMPRAKRDLLMKRARDVLVVDDGSFVAVQSTREEIYIVFAPRIISPGRFLQLKNSMGKSQSNTKALLA